MTLSDWLLAQTICLVLSVGWSGLLFGAGRLAEAVLPAADERHVLWWAGLLAAVAPLGGLAALALPGTGMEVAGPPPFLGDVLGAAAPSSEKVAAADGVSFLSVVLGILRAAAPFVVSAYGLGLAWHLVSHLNSRHRLKRLLAACYPLEHGELHASVTAWAGRLGLKDVPPVLLTPEPCPPFSARWRRPVLVMPASLLRRCPPEQAALICAHELAHVKRRDLVLMRVQSILSALLWFNSAAGAIAARLDKTREAACDDLVLDIARDSRRDYAQAFLASLRHSAGRPVCGIPFINPCREDHEMRLTHIMNGGPRTSRKLRLAAAALALAAIAVPMAGGQVALAEALAAKAPDFSGAVVAFARARMTSPYGPRLLRGKENFHQGVDIGAPLGTPVRSPGNGRVRIVSGDHEGYGKRIEIDYGTGWTIIFSQLNSYDVAEGDPVRAGQQIGRVGQSGVRATGPHLHLEVLRDGKHVDPATVLSLPAPRSKAKGRAVQN